MVIWVIGALHVCVDVFVFVNEERPQHRSKPNERQTSRHSRMWSIDINSTTHDQQRLTHQRTRALTHSLTHSLTHCAFPHCHRSLSSFFVSEDGTQRRQSAERPTNERAKESTFDVRSTSPKKKQTVRTTTNQPLQHQLTHSLTHSLTHCRTLTHSLTHSLTSYHLNCVA